MRYIKRIKLVFAFLLLHSTFTFAGNEIDSLLNVLDRTIAVHQIFGDQRQTRILKLKERMTDVKTLPEAYDLNMSLYKEYKAYVCDSAIHYLNKNIEVAQTMKDGFKEDESKLLLSFLLSSSGMYKEAVDMLESIDRSKLPFHFLPDYYSCFDHAYGELSFYTQDKKSSVVYRKISDTYKDSLYNVLNHDTDLFLSMRETAFRDNRQFAEALHINDLRLSKAVFGTPEYALITFHRALAFQENGDVEKEKKYLALSAISDIHSAITDHASLWMLAQLLYESGDVERSYRYIRFSWDETNFYNARLRSLQSAGILSLIDKTYQAMVEKQNRQLENYLMLISALVLMLIVALGYIYRQMKKLSVARNHLQAANGQLKQLNDELQEMNLCLQSTNLDLSESNQIKEEYIGRFIKLCSTYIDRLDAYRRMVSKKISGGQAGELLKMARSQEALDLELKELYDNFDSAFLQLFPDFVKKFNQLLEEEGHILPKKGELLNTELRIFALIRLGIDDSSQIAEFLRYSVNTIYNYRAKVKNKARVSRDDFESQVLKIR
nr:DUF6377 domain-containing protein [uncultured Bacteroides sp.]